MKNAKKNNPAIIAAVLFFLYSCLSIIGQILHIQYLINEYGQLFYRRFIWFIEPIGFLLLAVGLFKQSKKLCVSGPAVLIFSNALVIVLLFFGILFGAGAYYLLALIAAVFLLASAVGGKRSSVIFGVLSGIFLFFAILTDYLFNYYEDFWSALRGMYVDPLLFNHNMELRVVLNRLAAIFHNIGTPIACVLAGIGLSYTKEEKVAVIRPALKGNVIDNLTRLKALLDKGIITQDEFDAKKKQLLEPVATASAQQRVASESRKTNSSYLSVPDGKFMCSKCKSRFMLYSSTCPCCGEAGTIELAKL